MKTLLYANASQEGGGTVEEQLRQAKNDQISPLSAEQISETQDVISLQRQSASSITKAICVPP